MQLFRCSARMPSQCEQEQLYVSQKTYLLSVTKFSYLLLCREVIGIYVGPTKHFGVTKVSEDAEFMNITAGIA